MARCRCQESQCICVVTPGEGIEITGTGSASNPWVISNSATVAGAIEHQDTSSIDFTVTGAGDVADPYVISAQAIIGALINILESGDVAVTKSGAGTPGDPVQFSLSLKCIDCSAPANVGDVLTKQADGSWAAGPPAVAAPGLISRSEGLLGDGSISSPLLVRIPTYGDLKALNS